jgi:signal transduction histidine kinase/CheY-like chemotaxis protein
VFTAFALDYAFDKYSESQLTLERNMSPLLVHAQKIKTAQQKLELAFWSKLTLVVLAVTVAVAFLVVAAAAVLANQHNYVLSSFILVAGTSSLMVSMFMILHQQHEQRLHRIFTAMTAAETARAQAEAAAREKSRLLATMSHEIRTPLNGVIGMLGLLSETQLTLEQKNYADTAHSSGRILLSIIDEILDTAKSQSQAKQKQTDVAIIVESVTELLATRAHAKGIEVSAYVSPRVPHLLTLDDTRIRQVLFNLIGNAIKFTQQGGVAIDLDMSSAKILQITVRDSGIGMTAAEAAKIFTPFVQANDDTSRKFGGTGLGLSISQKLIEAMGGSIKAESQLNVGTSFIVELPVLETAVVEISKAALAKRHYVLAMRQGFARDHLQKALTDFGAETSIIENARVLNARLQSPQTTKQFICDSSYCSTLKAWAKKQKSDTPTSIIWVMLKAEERKENLALLAAPFAGYLLNPVRRSTLLNHLSGFDVKALKQTSQMLRNAKRKKIQKPAMFRRCLRILLAEDNAINALLARTILEKSGHSVKTVMDGQAAMEILQQDNGFDLVLLDMEMPKLNGLETAEAIRSDSRLKHLPLLALTANARPEDLAACLQAGMNDHLAKPFERLDLEDKIARLVSDTKAA